MGYARAPPLQDPGGCGSREAGRETRGLGDAQSRAMVVCSRYGRVLSRLSLLVLWWGRRSCALAIEFVRPLLVLRTTGIEPTHENQKACVAASAQLVP